MSPEGTRVWRKTGRKARRGVPTGRHRRPTQETSMQPQPAASLPLSVTAPAPVPAPLGPDEIVQCGNCQAIGPESMIPDVPTRGPRCADTDACTKRWYDGRPVSLVPLTAEALEPLPDPEPVLPPVQETALANFEAAHAEQEAAETGEPATVSPGDYLDGREDAADLDLPRLGEAAPDGGEAE